MGPDARVVVGLELEHDRQPVRFGLAGLALQPRDLLAGAQEVLDVVADLVGDHVGLGELAGGLESLRELLVEGQVEVELLVGGAVKRPDRGTGRAAALESAPGRGTGPASAFDTACPPSRRSRSRRPRSWRGCVLARAACRSSSGLSDTGAPGSCCCWAGCWACESAGAMPEDPGRSRSSRASTRRIVPRPPPTAIPAGEIPRRSSTFSLWRSFCQRMCRSPGRCSRVPDGNFRTQRTHCPW